MRRRHWQAIAAAFALGCAVPVVSARAEAQVKQPVGMLLAVGDIAECLTAADKKDLTSPNPKKRARAKEHTSNKSGAATAALIRQEIEKAKAQYPDIQVRVLALGDLAYDCGATSAFRCFHDTWGQFETDKILLPVPGNHEYRRKKGDLPKDRCLKRGESTAGSQKHAKPFFKYFENNDFAKVERGFSVLRFPDQKDGPWVLVGLNPYLKTGLSAADLKARLNGDEKDFRCILAFSHPPYYSSGEHGHDDIKQADAALGLTELLSSDVRTALYESRVTVLVAGHDHHYEQLGRANAMGNDDDNGAAAIDNDQGVRSFVVGTGGTHLYSTIYSHNWMFREAYDLNSRGVLRITLYATSYEWAFVPTKDNAASFKAIKNAPFTGDCNRL